MERHIYIYISEISPRTYPDMKAIEKRYNIYRIELLNSFS